MRLTYWYAQCLNDSDAYSLRAKTRREVKEKLEDGRRERSYGPVVKVTVEYLDAFDLMLACMEEGSGYWEAQAVIAWEEAHPSGRPGPDED